MAASAYTGSRNMPGGVISSNRSRISPLPGGDHTQHADAKDVHASTAVIAPEDAKAIVPSISMINVDQMLIVHSESPHYVNDGTIIA